MDRNIWHTWRNCGHRADFASSAEHDRDCPAMAADQRFRDLRASGYTGPIDQDGYAVTSGEMADTLRYMAEQRGETVNW